MKSDLYYMEYRLVKMTGDNAYNFQYINEINRLYKRFGDAEITYNPEVMSYLLIHRETGQVICTCCLVDATFYLNILRDDYSFTDMLRLKIKNVVYNLVRDEADCWRGVGAIILDMIQQREAISLYLSIDTVKLLKYYQSIGFGDTHFCDKDGKDYCPVLYRQFRS